MNTAASIVAGIFLTAFVVLVIIILRPISEKEYETRE
jgi:hypothetical protein